MKLNQECVMLQSELRKFAQQVLADRVDELEKSCSFPMDNVKRLAEMGIIGAVIPEKYGGAKLDTIGFAVVLEELGKVCASTAFIVAIHNAYFAYPILKFGSEELQKNYLPDAASGKILGGFALPKTNELNVEKTSDGYCINGRNSFVLNAAAGGPIIVVLNETGTTNTSLYVLDQSDAACKFNKTSNTIGLKSAGIGEFGFQNCCPKDGNLIGQTAQGQEIIQSSQDYARILFAAISLGIAQGATEAALKYAKERIQFQQPIITFGMVREQIADMAVKIEAARQLVYEAALRMDQGEEYRSAAAMAKLFAGQAATFVTTTAIQVYGGYGYMKDYPAERYFRDAQMLNVICSTPDEDKECIVKEMT
ncbi:MAG: acyl-CoA dehydrogenase family protein [candidate division WOR-3 bacterium]|jgi:butyryl-CoA dehydrogenase